MSTWNDRVFKFIDSWIDKHNDGIYNAINENTRQSNSTSTVEIIETNTDLRLISVVTSILLKLHTLGSAHSLDYMLEHNEYVKICTSTVIKFDTDE